jgi:Cytochrome bd terminal oxidase subunit II/Integrase core domain
MWLVTGGGALFAVFPDAYATVFSGFYTPFMLLLVSLIFRAVAIEFRGKVSSPMWRRMWDIAFAKRGYPESITVDNGSESCSRMMDAWAYRHGVKLDFIRPGGERIYRELQRPTAGRMLERRVVLVSRGRPR